MAYHVPFLRHVTSNKTYDFCMFYKFINFVPIDLKIGTHIDWTYAMYLAKNALIQIKHRALFKTLNKIISTTNEDIGQKFLPDTYDRTLMLYEINYLEWSKFKVTPRIHWFNKVLLYLIN